MQEHAAHSSQLTDLPQFKKVVFLVCNMWRVFLFATYVDMEKKSFLAFSARLITLLNPRDSPESQ